MKIDFFEEFPERINWKVFEKITFSSVIYIAARSFEEFRGYEKKLKKINPRLTAGYWPLLPKSYWVSPFSYPEELEALEEDLSSYEGKRVIPILLDLELPVLKKSLFIKNSLSFIGNRRRIRQIFGVLSRKNFSLLTAEYPAPGKVSQKLFQLAGISYPSAVGAHTPIVMYYTSMIRSPWMKKKFREHIIRRIKETGGNYQVGLGTIAVGIFGDEPILPPSALAEDLAFCRDAGAETAVIFQAEGVSAEYMKVIKKFVQ